MKGQISTGEILEALRTATAPENPTDFFVVSELAADTGIAALVIRRQLVRLKAMGLVEMRRVPRESLDGRETTVPAYRLRGLAKAKR